MEIIQIQRLNKVIQSLQGYSGCCGYMCFSITNNVKIYLNDKKQDCIVGVKAMPKCVVFSHLFTTSQTQTTPQQQKQ